MTYDDLEKMSTADLMALEELIRELRWKKEKKAKEQMNHWLKGCEHAA